MSRGHSYEDQVAWNPKYFLLADGQMRLLSEEKEAVRAESAVFVSCPSVHWCLSCQSQSEGALDVSLTVRHSRKCCCSAALYVLTREVLWPKCDFFFFFSVDEVNVKTEGIN